MKFSSVSFSLLLGLLCAFQAPAQTPEKPERIKAILSGSGIIFMPFYLGAEKGLYRSEGIHLEVTYVRGTLVGPAILSGGADYIVSLGTGTQFGAKGMPVKIVMGVTKGANWELFAQPAIKTINDLKGKIIQTGSIGGAQHRLVKLALKQLGLNPDKDVVFIGGGPSAQRILALQSGAAHAAVLAPPANFVAEEMGFRRLVDLGEILPVPTAGIMATEQKIKERPDQLKRMIRATLKGIDYVITHKEESVAWIIKDQKLARAQATRAYDDFVRSLARDGLLTEQQLRLLLQDDADVPLNQIADFSLLREILKENKKP